jgi:hypothetical protein
MRNLKVLGLALMAMFAMSAVAATAASADDFTAEKYPVTLTGANSTPNDQFVTTTGIVNCKKASYVGTVSGPTTSVSATPAYSECTAFGFPAIIDVNNCKYVFNIGAGTTGDADLTCEAGKSVTVTAIGAGTVKCTVHVLPQSDIAGTVTYTNVGAGATREIELHAALSGIDYSHTKGTGVGACTAGSATNGTLTASGKVTGEEDKASGALHIGIFLS